jgi:hypothetical protein
VSVTTADERGAGTDADITIILIGTKATSPELRLESSKDNFERGSLDEFMLDLGNLDLGEIQGVDIGLASKQSVGGLLGGLMGQAWCCTCVEVLHLGSGVTAFFPADQWVKGGGPRRLKLAPGALQDKNTYKVGGNGRGGEWGWGCGWD